MFPAGKVKRSSIPMERNERKSAAKNGVTHQADERRGFRRADVGAHSITGFHVGDNTQ